MHLGISGYSMYGSINNANKQKYKTLSKDYLQYDLVTRQELFQALYENGGIYHIPYKAGGKTYQVNDFSAGQTRIEDLSDEQVALLKEKYRKEPMSVEDVLSFFTEMTTLRIADGGSVSSLIRSYEGFLGYTGSGTSPVFSGIQADWKLDDWIRHFDKLHRIPNVFNMPPVTWVSTNPLLAEVTHTHRDNIRQYTFPELLRVLA